jgi:ERCC4-type nuclease
MTNNNPPTIIIDTREKRPYKLPNSQRGTLSTGDYSILHHEDKICIERKSKIDAYGSLGKNRERFKREMERLLEIRDAYLVIECTRGQFLRQPARSRMNPIAALHTIIAWERRYRLHVIWAKNRVEGQRYTLLVLQMYWRDYLREKKNIDNIKNKFKI